MPTLEQLQSLVDDGANLVNTSGDKIGKIGAIYLDDQTGEPSWVTVKTGLFGTAETFVPLSDSVTIQDGDVCVAYDKDTIKDAPSIEPDGNLSPQEESELYRYYGLESQGTGEHRGAPGTQSGVGLGTETADARRSDTSDTHRSDSHRTGTTGKDSHRTGTKDDGMTLSEERVDVGTRQEEVGKARLRKYVVTENVTKTVPVSREEVRVEREPISGDDRDRTHSGADIGEDEQEVILHEEQPVVDKEAVPVERVSLGTETVTDEKTVTEEVRKEKVDVDSPDADTRTRGDNTRNRDDDTRNPLT